MKRVLIVGAGIIDKPNAAGITLKSIFSEFDTNLLMGVEWRQRDKSQSAALIPTRYLSFPMISAARLLSKDCFKRVSQRMKKGEVSPKVDETHTQRKMSWQIAVKWIRQWIALLSAGSKVNISREDMAAIRAFDPEVIYTVGESVTALDIAYRLSKSFDIPIVIHFMDNWKHSIEWYSNPLLKGYQKRLKRYCDLCYSRSTYCIAIGEQMSKAYEAETGIKHGIIMNSIDTNLFSCEPRAVGEVIHFVYAGGLHLGRDKALQHIGECIERVCTTTGKRAMFSIYTSPENIDLFESEFSHLPNTKLCRAGAHDQICDIYRQSDVLVHVESTDLESNAFFKYSVSTKISEYLATGRPFLFWGPENISLFKLLRDNQLAYTVSNAQEIEETIVELMAGSTNRYSERAKKYAEQHFDISIAGKWFGKIIDTVALPSNIARKSNYD